MTSQFNNSPPTEPAADRAKRRNQDHIARRWVRSFRPLLSHISEERVASTMPQPEERAGKSHNEVLHTSSGTIMPALPASTGLLARKVSHGALLICDTSADSTAKPRPLAKSSNSKAAQSPRLPVAPPQGQLGDLRYDAGRIMQIYLPVNSDKSAQVGPKFEHNTILYSFSEQKKDYQTLLQSSLPEETFESHRQQRMVPSQNWQDTFSRKFKKLSVDAASTKEVVEDWNNHRDFSCGKLLRNLNPETLQRSHMPSNQPLAEEVVQLELRRRRLQAVREQIMKEAGVMLKR